MADKFDEFLEEVEGDIRQERLEKLWHQYGKQIIAVVVGALALSGGYMVWQSQQHKQSQLLSEKFVGAQNLIMQGKTSEALGVMQDLSKASHKHYAVLAKFYEAYLVGQKDYKAAEEVYKTISNDHGVEKHLRDLALIFLTTLSLDNLNPEIQEKVLEEALKNLEPLAQPDQPWRHLALELIGIAAYKKNDLAKATEIFLKLAQDSEVPEAMRGRVQLMTQTLASSN